MKQTKDDADKHKHHHEIVILYPLPFLPFSKSSLLLFLSISLLLT